LDKRVHFAFGKVPLDAVQQQLEYRVVSIPKSYVQAIEWK
jgi:hypothetical protein